MSHLLAGPAESDGEAWAKHDAAQGARPRAWVVAPSVRLLPVDSTDADLLAFVDEWVVLLEREDYAAAFAHTDHEPGSSWTPELIREVIKRYGEPGIDNRVTLDGRPTDISQRKSVTRGRLRDDGYFGYIWYDLNLNGLASDLTATFDLIRTGRGISVRLADIHVM